MYPVSSPRPTRPTVCHSPLTLRSCRLTPRAARPAQVVEDGYEFFAKRQLVTLFSAPNYCGEFDNAGGMMSVDETLMCSFQVSRGGGGRGARNPIRLGAAYDLEDRDSFFFVTMASRDLGRRDAKTSPKQSPALSLGPATATAIVPCQANRVLTSLA